MAFPDGYIAWGGTAADFTTTRYDLSEGVTLVRAKAAEVTIWDAPNDGTQVVNLYDHNQAPVTTLETAASGMLRTFYATDDHEALFASVDGGERIRLIPHATSTGTPGPAGPAGVIVLDAGDPDPITPVDGVLYVRKVS